MEFQAVYQDDSGRTWATILKAQSQDQAALKAVRLLSALGSCYALRVLFTNPKRFLERGLGVHCAVSREQVNGKLRCIQTLDTITRKNAPVTFS